MTVKEQLEEQKALEGLFAELKKPFLVEETQFRYQYGWSNDDGQQKKELCVVAPYIESRDVMDRLDAVVGAGSWETEVKDPHINTKRVKEGEKWIETQIVEVTMVMRVLLGGAIITREDSGYGDDRKSAVSDGLKRVGVQFGIGRYLYQLPDVVCERKQKKGRWDFDKASAKKHFTEILAKHYGAKPKDAEAERKINGTVEEKQGKEEKPKPSSSLSKEQEELRQKRWESLKEILSSEDVGLGVPAGGITPAYGFQWLRKRLKKPPKDINTMLLNEEHFAQVLEVLEEMVKEKKMQEGRATGQEQGYD